jgi:hypothetical protein
MTPTFADTELWRHLHRNCWQGGTFRGLEQARFVRNVNSGHGPNCTQYPSARDYISRTPDMGVAE